MLFLFFHFIKGVISFWDFKLWWNESTAQSKHKKCKKHKKLEIHQINIVIITITFYSTDAKHPIQYAVASPSSLDHGEISEISSFDRACPTSPGNGEISELSSFDRASSIARTEDYHTAEDCEIEEPNNFTIAQEIEKLSNSFVTMKVQVESLADEMATMKGSIEATTGKKIEF